MLQGALAAVLLVGVNVWSFHHYERVDCTRDRQFTLPAEVRKDLRQLDPDSKTTIIVYSGTRRSARSPTSRRTITIPPPRRKVVEKVKRSGRPAPRARRAATQRRSARHPGARTSSRIGSNRSDTQNAPELTQGHRRRRRKTACSSTPGEQRQAAHPALELQRLLSAGQDGVARGSRRPRQSRVALSGHGPFAQRLTHLEEKRPRIGIAVIHKVLTSTSDHDWGLEDCGGRWRNAASRSRTSC